MITYFMWFQLNNTLSHCECNSMPVVPTIKFGALYNWWAASNVNIAMIGWHVPSESEFETLILTLDPDADNPFTNSAGGNLKLTGTTFWSSPNTGADNSSGFTAVGEGVRDGYYGDFWYPKENTICLWATNEIDATKGAEGVLTYDSADFTAYINYARPQTLKKQGNSIRVLKNDSTNPGTVTDYDGNNYDTIKIGNQVWIVQSLRVTHYNDGTPITNVTDNAAWAALTTEAYCWYNNTPS
jgi:uncharacterized protein (TIGR02145 family)